MRQEPIFFELFDYRMHRGLQSCDPAGSLGLHNTTLGLRPRMVLWCCVWINSHIHVSKQGVTKAAFTQGAVLLQRSAALCCLAAPPCIAAPLQLDLLHRALFVSGSGKFVNGLTGAFTQGTASPAGGLVPKTRTAATTAPLIGSWTQFAMRRQTAGRQCKDACWNQLDPINGPARQRSVVLRCSKTAPCVKAP